MKANLRCVGEQKIKMVGLEFTLRAETEVADPEHNVITPAYIYTVICYLTIET